MPFKSLGRSEKDGWVMRWNFQWFKKANCMLCDKDLLRKPSELKKIPFPICNSCHGRSSIKAAKMAHIAKSKGKHITMGYVRLGRKGTGNYNKFEHTIIAEKALGRSLRKGEVVHHINGIRTDNRNSNLLICTQPYHRSLHTKMCELYQIKHFRRSNP